MRRFFNISDIFENASNHLSSKDYDKFNENTNDKIPWKNSLKMANGLDSGKQNLLFKILVLHKTLKRVRNNMNHAADDSPFKVPAINLALTEYISWLRRLF